MAGRAAQPGGGGKNSPRAPVGKLRGAGQGRRPWRAKLILPTIEYPYWRAAFKDPYKEKKWATLQMPKEYRHHDPAVEAANAEEWLAKIDAALDSNEVVSSPRAAAQERTMEALLRRYLTWLEGSDPHYVYNRKILITKWVLKAPAPAGSGRRVDGELPVELWGPSDSLRWITAARAGVGPKRVEDLGVALAGMRDAAQRLEAGARWMAEGRNPLQDVKFSRSSTRVGAARDWVSVEKRPTTAHVESLEAAVDAWVSAPEAETGPEPSGSPSGRRPRQRGRRLPRWAWQPTQVRIGTRCGLRLGEQMGLRHVDVDLEARELRITQRVGWPRPKEGLWWAIGPTKTSERRQTPYPGRIHVGLLELVRAALGLPPLALGGLPGDELLAVEADTVAAQEAVRPRYNQRDEGTYDRGSRAVEPDEGLLFVAGLVPQHLTYAPGETPVMVAVPPTKEIYGEVWREQRKTTSWPTHLPWANARHHAATWWPKVLSDPATGRPYRDEVYAAWLGHSLATYQGHYVRVGADDLATAREQMREL